MWRRRWERPRSASSDPPARGIGRRSNPISAALQQTTEKLDCQPRHKPVCRVRHHRCMRNISADEVLDGDRNGSGAAPTQHTLHSRADIVDRRHNAAHPDDFDAPGAERAVLVRFGAEKDRDQRHAERGGKVQRPVSTPTTKAARAIMRATLSSGWCSGTAAFGTAARDLLAAALGLRAPRQQHRKALRGERAAKLDPVNHRPFLLRASGRVQQNDLVNARFLAQSIAIEAEVQRFLGRVARADFPEQTVTRDRGQRPSTV